MRALVLSGGGNRGALQVGALRALLERNFEPDIIIGCSVGALNAGFLAQDFSLKQVDNLLNLWRQTRKEDVYPGGRLQILWRFISGKESLHDNRNFYAHLQRSGATPAFRFGDIPERLRLFITATHLDSQKLHVFGDRADELVLDAVMASTALPPLHPPWTVGGERFIDGGTVTPLPLRVAIERGADEIFALHIWDEPKPMTPLQRGVAAIIDRSINTMLRLQSQHDLHLVQDAKKVRLHDFRLWTDDMPGINDWSQSDRLHDAGYQLMQRYLEREQERKASNRFGERSGLRRLGRRLVRRLDQIWGSSAPDVTPVEVSADLDA